MLASPAHYGQMLARTSTRRAKSTPPHVGQAGVVSRKKYGPSNRPHDYHQ